MDIRRFFAASPIRQEKPVASEPDGVRISVTRGQRTWTISPEEFEDFDFVDEDRLAVVTEPSEKAFPVTWGDTNVPISPGRAIRVPPVYRLHRFKGFDIPSHLIALTGAGADSLDEIGKGHIERYDKYVGLSPGMTLIDLGCGIGRDAFQLIGYLGEKGRYIGIDVTRDSIRWCQRNITPRHGNFVFHHADARNELYNPFGTIASRDYRLPVADGTVDRIVLASVFTHLLADEVVHYMEEFRRVLKADGLVYASFFLYSEEALAAAAELGNTSWKATFEHRLGDGCYGNDPVYPRGAVAYTDEAMRRMMDQAGLRLVRPYLKGWWSGLHGDAAEDGQDVAILARA